MEINMEITRPNDIRASSVSSSFPAPPTPHQPSGNGMVERCHRTMKQTVARTGCSVRDAVYLHNVTPYDDKSAETAPANAIYAYEVRVRGIDKVVRDPGVVKYVSIQCERSSVGPRPEPQM